MDTLNLTIGIVGAVASLGSLLIAAPDWKSRAIHFFYTSVVVLVVALLSSMTFEIQSRLNETRAELTKRSSLEVQAQALLESFPRLRSTGEPRGIILSSLAFLEKYKQEIPDTYAIAKGIAERVSDANKPFFEGESEQQDYLRDAATAMEQVIRGLAAPKR
jgi:hypothetical protein